jgi:antitoxin YefM
MTTLSLADARATFSKIVESAERTHERFFITRNGDRVAVLLGAADFDRLMETLEVIGDKRTLEAIRSGLNDLAESTADLSELEEVEAEINAQKP